MKRFNKITSLALATIIAFSSVTAFAAEDSYVATEETFASVEDFNSIDEILNYANDITEEDIDTLKDNTNILGAEDLFGISLCDDDEDAASVDTEVLVNEEYTYSTATAMANFAGLGYYSNGAGPISVVQATLHDNNGKDKTVWLVGLSGTAFVKGQATGVVTDLLSGFNINNDYTKAVCNVLNNIPGKNQKIVFVGHSLGGMVAQQVSANKDIKKKFEILNTVCFGSPVVTGISREGATQRLGDSSDFIPYLSATGVLMPIRAIGGLNREDGNYGGVKNGWTAHLNSYSRLRVWGNYDVLGVKGGHATITFNTEDVEYYQAPSFFK